MRWTIQLIVLFLLISCSGSNYYIVSDIVDGNKIQLSNGLRVILEDVDNVSSNIPILKKEILSKKVYLYDRYQEEITSFNNGWVRAFIYDEDGKCINELFMSNQNAGNLPVEPESGTTVASDNQIPSSTRSLSSLYKTLKPAVFMVIAASDSILSQGSGFFIHPSGIGISNYHVFKGTNTYNDVIFTADDSALAIRNVIRVDTSYDYIIFRVENHDNCSFPYLKISRTMPQVGEDCFAIGNPKGLTHTLSTGIISQIRYDSAILQTTASFTFGSSGGPLFNANGEVIGITTAIMGDNLNFAVSIHMLNLEPLLPQYNDLLDQLQGNVQVERVIDGDTFVIMGGERVRLIGVDTPEMRGGPEPLAVEATEFTKKMIENKCVHLELDMDERDQYGRILAYVYIDGTSLNEELLKQGLARLATFPPNVRYVDRFIQAQNIAQANKLGCWNDAN